MKIKFNYDSSGIKYRFPERSCLTCKNYPCDEDLNKLDADFAKYGCQYYS